MNPPSGGDGREPVRTYVVVRHHGRPLAGSPPLGYVEAEPLGTIEARMPAEAQAAARWPDVPPRTIRVRMASAAAVALFATALARDGAPDAPPNPARPPGAPPPAG